MNIESILAPERTFCGIQASSKKKAIEEVAILLSSKCANLGPGEIYESLIGREKLGTTAIGHGIAIPHSRVAQCEEIVGGLFKLATPIDFGAFDEEFVQILFVLLVPANEVDEHLKTLAMLAGRFESDQYRQALLGASTDQDLFEKAIAD